MLEARSGGPLPDQPLTPHPVNADKDVPLEDDDDGDESE